MKKPTRKSQEIEDATFISPTVEVLYKEVPGWVSNKEMLYVLGFNLATMRDEHGFDVYGFNELGIDRIGCSAKDYERADIGRETLALARYNCQGSYKPHYSQRILRNPISVPLPTILEVRKGFDDICEANSGSRPIWFDMAGSNSGGLSIRPRASSWFGNNGYTFRYIWYVEGREYEFRVKSAHEDTKSSDSCSLNFIVQIKSPFTNGEDSAFRVRCNEVDEVVGALQKISNAYLLPARDYQLVVVDGERGPKLVASLEAELESVNGDIVGSPIVATSPLDAIERCQNNLKSTFMKQAAINGIKSLSGISELQKRVETVMAKP
jgi:hypothetical protein